MGARLYPEGFLAVMCDRPKNLLTFRLAADHRFTPDPHGQPSQEAHDHDRQDRGKSGIDIEDVESFALREDLLEGRFDRIIPRQCGDQAQGSRGQGDHGLQKGAERLEGSLFARSAARCHGKCPNIACKIDAWTFSTIWAA
jgi:hypothetical protein